MCPVPMLVPLLAKLAEEKPFHVERQNSVLREIDASLLLVLYSLSRGTDMTVNVQDRREFSLPPFRLIKNRNGLKAGYDLIAKFAQPVALACFDHSDVFKLWRRVDPLIGPTLKHRLETPPPGANAGGGVSLAPSIAERSW